MCTDVDASFQVKDYLHMLELINDVIAQPPIFRDPRGGAPGLSFNNILASVIVTPSGFNAFINDALNEAFKRVLSDWCTYLLSLESARDSLTDDKWLSNESIIGLSQSLYDFDPEDPKKAFKRAFVGDNEDKDYWGFLSWNDFFSRPFISAEIFDEYRPMADPNNPNLIINPADSRMYGIATNVSEMDSFWLKGHRYSLKHLLNGDEGGDGRRHEKFIGGTVYQAYLLPSDYHQWAMPFSGTLKEVITMPGTYFALSNALVDPAQPDEFASLVEGLPYLCTVSARKIAILEADDEKIGTVCFIPVGLQEISSLKFFHEENKEKHLEKGEALGAFQFGGSTVCLVFEPKVNIKWRVSQLEHVLIKAAIAEVY